MNIFISDIDNTLIYSYKKYIGENTIPVEYYNGKYISYMTNLSYKLLSKLSNKIMFVPLTTRSVEQYKRINFGYNCVIKYALAANGGILIKDGKIDYEYKKDSIKIISPAENEIKKAIKALSNDSNIYLNARIVDEMFVFAKTQNISYTLNNILNIVDSSKVSVLNNGEKIYVIPKNLNKGNALKRFKKYIGADKIISAGDSLFDLDMLKEADISFAPYWLKCNINGIIKSDEKVIFSDFVLKSIEGLGL